MKPRRPLFWGSRGVPLRAVLCSCLKRAHKDRPNWAICPYTLHIRQQILWSSITALLERRGEGPGVGNILQQHIVGIPSHWLRPNVYFCRSMFQTHITSSLSPTVKYLHPVPLSSLSWLAVSSHLCPLSPLTFSRGQQRSGVSGLAIVSDKQTASVSFSKTRTHAQLYPQAQDVSRILEIHTE